MPPLLRTGRLLGAPDGPPGYRAGRAWPKLAARSLVTAAPAPGGEWLWFVDHEAGPLGRMRLRQLSARGDGGDAETLLEPDELVYNLAFHPRFAENGWVFFGVNGRSPRAPGFRAWSATRCAPAGPTRIPA